MSKIPTVEEFIRTNTTLDVSQYEDTAEWSSLVQFGKNFAKLHVEAALKAAYGKAEIDSHFADWEDNKVVVSEDNYEATYTIPYIEGGRAVVINEQSILSAYSLENIK